MKKIRRRIKAKQFKINSKEDVGRGYMTSREKVYLEGIDKHLDMVQEAYGNLRTVPNIEFIEELDMLDADGNPSNNSFVFNYDKSQLSGNFYGHLAPEDDQIPTSRIEELALLGMHEISGLNEGFSKTL